MSHPLEPFFDQARDFLYASYDGREARTLWTAGQGIADVNARVLFYSRVIEDTAAHSIQRTKALATYRQEPVDVETFIKDPYYLDKASEIWPKVLEELIECNSGQYDEAVFTGGIGSAKSSCGIYVNQYQLYRLSCMVNPHEPFGLDPTDEILMIFQSVNKTVSMNSYRRFRMGIEQSRYFQEQFPWNPELDSRMDFPNRISVVPASGRESSLIGQNVIGGMIDELNYMAVVGKSRQSVDAGTYDQAVALYNSIARRRKSRFSKSGENLPGLLCLVSSKRYPGQFTDLKEEEARKDLKETGKTRIFIYDYSVYDIKPHDKDGNPPFSPERFRVFAGDEYRRPRILTEKEQVALEDEHLVRAVPIDFRKDFERDIVNALREIAGVSTLARHPYLVNTEAVTACFQKEIESIFNRTTTDFLTDKVAINPKRFFKPHLPRFAHVDLGITGDCAGLSIGTVIGFKTMAELVGGSEKELMPVVRFDGSLQIRPPKMGEILFHKIREIMTLCRKMGLNVRWITYDSFQSRDSIQMLRQQGYVSAEVSVDRTPEPYDFLKGAIYSKRVLAPPHPQLQKELASLERDPKTGKVDHPPGGSKDIADSMAGVAYGLTMRREIWGLYKISPMSIPPSIRATAAKQEAKEEKAAAQTKREAAEVLA